MNIFQEDDDTKTAKTVYCKGFEKENTSLDDLLAFFAKCAEGVVHVNRRTWADRETNTRNFKGSVFVTFKDIWIIFEPAWKLRAQMSNLESLGST